jgi:hypothetical protein
MSTFCGTSRRRTVGSNIRRKNLNIDQTKLDRVRDLLGAKTETEAIDRTLDILLHREVADSL